MIFDHLTMFPDEPTAQAALPEYMINGNWREDVTFDTTARTETVAADGTVTKNYLPGYFRIISKDQIDPTLPGCRLIANRDTAAVVWVAPDMDPTLLSSVIIEPTPAGSEYHFGN